MLNKEIENCFIQALEDNDLDGICKITKSDMHNHAGRGRNMDVLKEGL